LIGIVNYGLGNLGSVMNMFKRIGAQARVISTPDEVLSSRKLLLPGVGAFDTGMSLLADWGWHEVLNEKVIVQRAPVLGICLGMQLLTDGSDEGRLPGLGWIRGRAKSLAGSIDRSLKVPHMGWNHVRKVAQSPLTEGLPADSRFYFVHSYYVHCECQEDVVLTAQYGLEFHAALQRGNIFGAQFHPEKSHRFGMKLLENFARL
jgi:glutamine amidotransferase